MREERERERAPGGRRGTEGGEGAEGAGGSGRRNGAGGGRRCAAADIARMDAVAESSVRFETLPGDVLGLIAAWAEPFFLAASSRTLRRALARREYRSYPFSSVSVWVFAGRPRVRDAFAFGRWGDELLLRFLLRNETHSLWDVNTHVVAAHRDVFAWCVAAVWGAFANGRFALVDFLMQHSFHLSTGARVGRAVLCKRREVGGPSPSLPIETWSFDEVRRHFGVGGGLARLDPRWFVLRLLRSALLLGQGGAALTWAETHGRVHDMMAMCVAFGPVSLLQHIAARHDLNVAARNPFAFEVVALHAMRADMLRFLSASDYRLELTIWAGGTHRYEHSQRLDVTPSFLHDINDCYAHDHLPEDSSVALPRSSRGAIATWIDATFGTPPSPPPHGPALHPPWFHPP